eukprot:2724556-Prymnesium_polylepis.1
MLNGSIDLRMVDVLRTSECKGAPAGAIDIVVKGSDRTYTFGPSAGEQEAWVISWLQIIASAVPQSAVASNLEGFRHGDLVASLMAEAGSHVMSERAPGGLGRALRKLGSCTAAGACFEEEQRAAAEVDARPSAPTKEETAKRARASSGAPAA